jgi:3-hydroxyisobutyrate dehydrogenase-like beta-hydroxyacid dehydrogenase
MNIGFVGVGEMGRPMVARLLGASFPVRFHARRPEVISQVVSLGGTDAGSRAGVADGSDVVILCVYSDDQVRDVCLGPDGLIASMGAGSTLVNHTTGSPTTAELLAAEARPRGVHVLDAALSGGPADVARGNLTLLIGGDEPVLDRARPALEAYCDPILHVGRLGDGQRIKLVNNALFGAHVALVAEAERVAAGLGVDPIAALKAITHCSGDSYALRTVITLGSSARMQSLAGRFIQKDVAMVVDVAADLGTDLGLLRTAALYQGETE